MNINEAYTLAIWVKDTMASSKLPARLTSLHSVLQTNTQANQQKQPVEPQRKAVLASMALFDLEALTIDQQKMLEDFGLLDYLGANGASYVEFALAPEGIDIVTAAKRIRKAVDNVTTGVAKFGKLEEALQEVASDDSQAGEDEVIVRLYFTQGASINDIADFKTWAAEWYVIGRGFAQAHGDAPESIRVVGAHSGSIVVTLAVGLAIANSIVKAFSRILAVAEQVYDVRIKAEELRALQFDNAAKIAQQLDEEAVALRDKSAQAIGAEMTKELKLKADKKTGLETAITRLVKFIDAGGKVDCLLPAQIEVDDESEEEAGSGGETELVKQLRHNVEDVRSRERRVRMLNPKSAESE